MDTTHQNTRDMAPAAAVRASRCVVLSLLCFLTAPRALCLTALPSLYPPPTLASAFPIALRSVPYQ